MHSDPQQRRWHRNYLLLAPLCLLVAFYQVTYTVIAFRDTARWDQTSADPFQIDNSRHVSHPGKQIAAAGLKDDDYVVTIGGRDATGDRVFMEETGRRKPGTVLPVEVIHHGETAISQIRLPLATRRDGPPILISWLILGMLTLVPLLCVAAAIYVVLRRPDDMRAFVVFGLLISISQVVKTTSFFSFPEPLWELSIGISTVGGSAWPTWMALFGLYFPQRFEWDKRRPWVKWLLIAPLLSLPIISFFDREAALDHYWMVAPLDGFLRQFRFDAVSLVLVTISIGVFFWALAVKTATVTNRDSKRRLQLLRWGTATALTPLGVLVFYTFIAAKGSWESIPEWVVIAACAIFFIFPMTLAYVVVAERAMNVGMVLRQSVRYTLTKAGLRVALALVATGIITGVNFLVFGNIMSESVRITTIIIGVVIVIIGVRYARKYLLAWVDRKFFRDAYNSEQILEELSDSVRTMVDEEVLLNTVSRRISESMHVENVAVLLNREGAFHPVYCLGLNLPEHLALPETAVAVEQVKHAKDPPRIYFDDEKNWVYQTPEAEAEVLRFLNSQLLLPVGFKDRLHGILSLGPKRSEEPYSRTDVQLLRAVALQTGLALENSRLMNSVAHEIAQREKLNREIEIAREVQERLFPQVLAPVPGLDYVGACRPALGVGGDYYDFIALPNGDLGVAIGDVSGKGIAAALLMASLQASLRGQTILAGGDLAVVMSNVNRLIYDATPANRYATFFYGQYCRETRVFTYVNAGHNPPIILRRQGDETHLIRLETGGAVVGLFRNTPYQQATVPLQPGDVFIGFTDGVSEAMNHEDEEWGEERLIPTVAGCASRPAVEIIPAILQAADRFADGAPQHDDMTLIVVKVLGAEELSAAA